MHRLEGTIDPSDPKGIIPTYDNAKGGVPHISMAYACIDYVGECVRVTVGPNAWYVMVGGIERTHSGDDASKGTALGYVLIPAPGNYSRIPDRYVDEVLHFNTDDLSIVDLDEADELTRLGPEMHVQEYYLRKFDTPTLDKLVKCGEVYLLDDFTVVPPALPDMEPVTEPVMPEPEVPVYDSKPVPFTSWTRNLAHVGGLANIGQNILLVGPSGCGKTTLARKVADDLGRRFASQSCTAGMSESQLVGWLLPVGEGGRFEYVPSTFVDFYENGGVYLLDELDAADENTLLFIDTAIGGDAFHIPQRFGNTEVKRHADFVCMAAANTFGLGESLMYTGRNQLDGATLDRFRAGIVVMDYDEDLERRVVDPDVLAWALPIRAAIKEHKLERIMSTR